MDKSLTICSMLWFNVRRAEHRNGVSFQIFVTRINNVPRVSKAQLLSQLLLLLEKWQKCSMIAVNAKRNFPRDIVSEWLTSLWCPSMIHSSRIHKQEIPQEVSRKSFFFLQIDRKVIRHKVTPIISRAIENWRTGLSEIRLCVNDRDDGEKFCFWLDRADPRENRSHRLAKRVVVVALSSAVVAARLCTSPFSFSWPSRPIGSDTRRRQVRFENSWKGHEFNLPSNRVRLFHSPFSTGSTSQHCHLLSRTVKIIEGRKNNFQFTANLPGYSPRLSFTWVVLSVVREKQQFLKSKIKSRFLLF